MDATLRSVVLSMILSVDVFAAIIIYFVPKFLKADDAQSKRVSTHTMGWRNSAGSSMNLSSVFSVRDGDGSGRHRSKRFSIGSLQCLRLKPSEKDLLVLVSQMGETTRRVTKKRRIRMRTAKKN